MDKEPIVVETFMYALSLTSVLGEYALYRNGEFVLGIDEDDMREIRELFDKFDTEDFDESVL